MIVLPLSETREAQKEKNYEQEFEWNHNAPVSHQALPSDEKRRHVPSFENKIGETALRAALQVKPTKPFNSIERILKAVNNNRASPNREALFLSDSLSNK